MREFVSWVEKDGAVVYLTAKDLKTSRGRKLAKRIAADVNGHGAIREYWDIPNGVGTDMECTDFTTPENFPPQIVAAIKAGEFGGIGIALGLLSPAAWAQYDAVRDSAWAQHDAVRDSAWAQHDAVRDSAWAQHDAVRDSAWAQHDAVRDSAWAQHDAVRDSAWAQHDAVRMRTFWGLFAENNNRAEAWKEV